ncbi:hypothetical protein PDQ34_22870 [Bacillus cereus]|nr:hypothetical protein [Bacillus cereus]MDA2571904.1 hypothetical protein [Bacillus cereus]
MVFADEKDNNILNTSHYGINDISFEDVKLGTMTVKEKEAFYKLIEIEVANYPGNSMEKEQYRNALIGIFDPNDINFNNLDKTAELMSNDRLRVKIIGVNILGSVLNVAIGTLVTGSLGYGAISTYIKAVDKKEAQRVFTKTVKSKLIAVGACTFATSVGSARNIALDYINIGGKIASWLDCKDKQPKNGWIDV